MRFLIEANRKQRKRLQVEKLLLLIVRCCVVLLAGLALAGPVLGGCSRDGLSLAGGGGRVVYIVIDDALSSQTREAGGTRLDQLQSEALKVVDEMGPGDRAVIIRMARPVEPVVEAPSADVDALRESIQAIEPRYSRGALVDALMMVDASMKAQGVRDGDAVVVLLSDFPASSDYFEQVLPPELEGFGDRASIVTALPPQGTDNLQVMSLEPRRRMVVAQSSGATVVGGRVSLRRFGSIAQPREAELAVRVQSADGGELASTKRKVTWPAGEREQGVNFDLPVRLPGDTVSGVGRELVIVAELVPGTSASGVDVLLGDDYAFAVVRLRDRLQVAMVDDDQGVEPEPGGFYPGQWVRAALAPDGPGADGPFEVSPLLATSLNNNTLDPFDAVVVLRPDEVTARGWEALNTFSKEGGLVWFFAPALETEPDWAQALVRTYGVPWSFGEHTRSVQASDGSPERPAVAVDSTTSPPEPLQFLAADWREKLGWVSVKRWLSLKTPKDDQWIVLEDAKAGDDDEVLMASRRVGQGSLVVLASALDTRFTNLPVRALFVPLMHDTLRGVLGGTSGEPAVLAGDQPVLNRSWRGVSELARIDDGGVVADADAQTMLLQGDGDAVVLRKPAALPGVYLGTLSGTARLLAVNPDSAAGDTLGGRQQLELMLDELGGWAYLNDQREAGGVLTVEQQGMDLTRLLLWALLGLVLIETVIGRWFSHATDRDRPTIVGRVLGALHGDSTTPKQAGGGV